MPAMSEEIYVPDKDAENANLENHFSSLTMEGDQWKITRFKTTPPMSSYIVAFANGHFEFLEKTVDLPLSGRTIPLRIYGEIFSLQAWQSLTIFISDFGQNSSSTILT
jgi:aminopeptidase 2